MNARRQFDGISDRLETQSRGRHTDFFDFVLADAELVRARNKDECRRIVDIQASVDILGEALLLDAMKHRLQTSVAEQLASSLDNMKNEQKSASAKPLLPSMQASTSKQSI